MKEWKVILAALVIFAAGVVTGGLTVRLKQPEPPPAMAPSSFGSLRQRGELLDRMQRQLYLSADQRTHIEQILRDNHDHMKQLWDSIAPQAQAEHKRVHDLIMAQLTPEQQKHYQEILKFRGPNRGGIERRHWEQPPFRHNALSNAAPANPNSRDQ